MFNDGVENNLKQKYNRSRCHSLYSITWGLTLTNCAIIILYLIVFFSLSFCIFDRKLDPPTETMNNKLKKANQKLEQFAHQFMSFISNSTKQTKARCNLLNYTLRLLAITSR